MAIFRFAQAPRLPFRAALQAKVKAYFDPTKGPEESTGTMERKLIMGGRFLQEKYEGKAMGQPFFGMGIMGYDKLKKKYTAVWIDTMTTSIMHSLGTYDAEKKTFTYVSDDLDPYTGKKMKTRDVLKIVSDTQISNCRNPLPAQRGRRAGNESFGDSVYPEEIDKARWVGLWDRIGILSHVVTSSPSPRAPP